MAAVEIHTSGSASSNPAAVVMIVFIVNVSVSVSTCCRAMFTDCLSNVGLIPPCDRLLLEMEFAELCKWAVNKLRSCLLEIEQFFAGQQACVDNRVSDVPCHNLNTLYGSFDTPC